MVTQGGTLCNLGMTLGRLGQIDEALAPLDRADSVLRGLLRAAPTHEQGHLFLRNTSMTRAQVLELADRYAEAAALWTTLYGSAPTKDRADIHLRLALNYAQLGKEIEMRDWLVRGVGRRSTPVELLRCAMVLSRLAEAEPDLVLRRLHMDEALDYLQQTLDRGGEPPTALLTIPELGLLVREGLLQELVMTKSKL